MPGDLMMTHIMLPDSGHIAMVPFTSRKPQHDGGRSSACFSLNIIRPTRSPQRLASHKALSDLLIAFCAYELLSIFLVSQKTTIRFKDFPWNIKQSLCGIRCPSFSWPCYPLLIAARIVVEDAVQSLRKGAT